MELDIKTLNNEKWINYSNLIKILNSMKNIKIEKMKESTYRNEKYILYIKIINELLCRFKKVAKEPIKKGEKVADIIKVNETYCKKCNEFTLTKRSPNNTTHTCQSCGDRKSPKKIFRRSQKTEFEIGGLRR